MDYSDERVIGFGFIMLIYLICYYPNCATVMKGYIYKYTFPDGKVYIGQTRRDPQIRHREHISPVTGSTNGGFWRAYSTF